MKDYAPIVVFAYNRADRLEELLQCLTQNKDTNEMKIYIFVDIPDKKNKKDLKYNTEVRNLLANYVVHKKNIFKEIVVEIAHSHKGLAKSVIEGVSKVINKYGKVIVLEDDLMVSHDFLDYMQRGLCFYENDKKIWSLAGHCPKVDLLENYKKDVFLAPRVESLGWGTWKDRWNRTDWKVSSYSKFRKDIVGQMIFNLGGNDLTKMLKTQMMDEGYNSWAIRWCYQEFIERKYTVYPKESRVIHCGNDDRSTHGIYYSTQSLKEEYRKCHFEHVTPDLKLIWNFRKACSVPLIKRMLKK